MASKLTHTQAARKTGATLETLVTRILRTFDRATPSDIEAGARWYDEAGDLATELGARTGHGRLVAAAVIAPLSPRTTWTRNVDGAVRLLETDGASILPGLIGRNAANAQSIIRDGWDDPAESFNGPKTARFYANIIGDREAVTVDVWAARVAGVDEDKLGLTGVYDALEHAYRLAARRRGVDPATMQATTWVVARNGRAS